ncbi:MAG: LWR-salt protein [Halobacteriota archaeon]
MDAAYVFRVRFRLEPTDVHVSPAEFETVVRLPAVEPGTSGWLFFRDALWRGSVGDERHIRGYLETRLGVPVTAVTFSDLETDEEYLSALKEAIRVDLEAFNADDVPEVLTKYLGSSIRVT